MKLPASSQALPRRPPGGPRMGFALGVFLGLAQHWVGFSWLDPASGLPFPGLVLTFGKLSPHEVESWDGTTLDIIKHKPGLVLAFETLPPHEVES